MSWTNLFKAIQTATPKDKQPRWLPPKYVRKTAAELIRHMPEGGKEVADMFLSHADEGIITHYAGRDWERLSPCLTKLREMLQPMFEAVKDAPAPEHGIHSLHAVRAAKEVKAA